MPAARIAFLSLASVFVLGGCAEDPASAATGLSVADASLTPFRSSELPLYGEDRAPGSQRTECREGGFRGFDFWVGTWDVFAPGAGQVGTNDVLVGIEGCAVFENWTDQSGGRGRSLNTFDAGTGLWHQLWMDAGGLALILEGTASRGQMQMTGDAPRQFGGPVFASRITWTSSSESRVRQLWEESQDGHETWTPVFDGDYQRRSTIVPAPEAQINFCLSPSRPRYLWFDFLIGQWTVRRGLPDGKALGRLSVSKDLGGCLVESEFRGDDDYQGRAFAVNHFPTRTWYRDWMDADGVRIGLTGVLVGSNMVMTGERVRSPGVTQQVRATWSPVSADRVDETWEVSIDGGVSWSVEHHFVLIRS